MRLLSYIPVRPMYSDLVLAFHSILFQPIKITIVIIILDIVKIEKRK